MTKPLLFAFSLLAALAVPLVAHAAGDPEWSYSWPCNGSSYSNVVLIHEAAFPESNPGAFGAISGAQVNAFPQTKKPVEIETVLVLRNRRDNRPEGFEQKLGRGVFGHAGSHFTPTVPSVELVEGDVISIGMTCTPADGKVPRRWFDVLYSVDLFGAPLAAQGE
jgi:hypothetical protein